MMRIEYSCSRMKRLAACLILATASLPALAGSDFLFLPGVVAIFEYADMPPALGFSVKGVFSPEAGAVSNAFELRGSYSLRRELYRMDLTWPNFYGFLYPGISLDFSDGEVIPWFYAELDLFYFPFAFAAFMAFKKPVVIPSAFVGLRMGSAGVEGDIGARLSFPIYGQRGKS